MNGCFINIVDGKLKEGSKEPMRRVIRDCPTGRYWFEPKPKSIRTHDQNAYLHTIFPLIKDGLRDIGYREIKTAEDAKWVCKSLFLSHEIDNGTGGKIKMMRRTRDLTKDQMATFIDEIIQWAAEYLSIEIPPPLTQTEIKF